VAHSKSWFSGRLGLARFAALTIVTATAANFAFNFVMFALGYHWPLTSFLFRPDDQWADFFKMAFSYGSPHLHPPVTAWSVESSLDSFMQSVERYRGSQLNSDHMLPVSTLLAVLVRRAMNSVDPVLLFIACLAAGLIAFVATLRGFVTDRLEACWWGIAVIGSYPVIFMVDRGHFFSLICALSLMAGTGRLIDSGRMNRTTLGLLALACCIRPNVVALPALLVLGGCAGQVRDLVRLGCAIVLLFVVSMIAAHALYPHYGPATWLHGLADYQQVHVAKPVDAGFFSSLPSMLDLVFGHSPIFEFGCFALAAALGLVSLVAGRADRLTVPKTTYIGLALMVIATPSLGDYHLIPFLLPLLLMAREGGAVSRADSIAVIASIALLIPKNYVYGNITPHGAWSYQVILNPLIALGVTLWLLADAYRRPSRETGELDKPANGDDGRNQVVPVQG
jgi:hypothetical protein